VAVIGRGSRADRVAASHDIAWGAFRLALAAAAVAAVWAVVAAVRGGSWWGPLHVLLAGTAVLAISGATQLFTTTWSAAVPPDRRLAAAQRTAAALGAAGAVAGVTGGVRWLAAAGGALLVVALALLAFSLLTTVRRSHLRRFDLSARFYLLAIACAVVGVSLGAVMGALPETRPLLRLPHLHLNLTGFVGLTILGTIPTFVPTLAHHRAVSGREALAAWWLAVVGAGLFAAGAVPGGGRVIGAGAACVATAGVLLLGGMLLRLPPAVLRRGGVPLGLVVAGVVWLLVWTGTDAVLLLGGDPRGADGVRLAAGAVGGVGQVLAGSLAYLVPVVTRRRRRLGRERGREGG